MFCPNCGTQLPDAAKFCINCGHTMTSEQTPPGAPPQSSLGSHPGRDGRTSFPIAFEKPIKTKEKSPLPVIIIALALVLVAAAAAVWFFLVRPESIGGEDKNDDSDLQSNLKTVYLLREYKYNSGNYSFEQEYVFDENGLLLSYDQSGGGFGRTTRSTVNYEYEDGQVVSAVFAFHNPYGVEIGHAYEGLELEYVYDDDVLVGVNGKNRLDEEFKAACDDEGRINKIVLNDSDGTEWSSISYTYDDDGNLKEKVACRVDIEMKQVDTYEDGNLVESVIYQWGNLSARRVRHYDKDGNLIENNEWSYDENNAIRSSRDETYTYNDDGKLLSFSFSSQSHDGSGTEFSYVVEWENDTFAKVTYAGDYDHAYEEWEYDEHGNHICTRSYDAEGELVAERTWTYVEVKIPSGRKPFSENDPFWFLWLMDN